MISNSEIFNQKLLLYLAITIGFIFLVANLVNQEEYSFWDGWYATDILFTVVLGVAIIFGIVISIQYKGKGSHGKAWIFLTLSMISWFAADQLWSYEVETELQEFYSLISESLYLLGYPLFLGFSIYYLKPRKRLVTKKIMLSSLFVSMLLVIPSVYISLSLEDEGLELSGVFYAISYPILDAIILVPAIIGMTLFIRGQVNLLWTSLMFGLLLLVIGDSLYLGSFIDDSHYPGHISDIFYVWSYLFMVFGIYSHVKLFKSVTITNKID